MSATSEPGSGGDVSAQHRAPEPGQEDAPQPPRRRRGRVLAVVLAAALIGYGVADARDVVPGILTTTPAPPPAQPFPEPSASVQEATTPEDLTARGAPPTTLQALAEAFAVDPRVTAGVPGGPAPGAPASAPGEPPADPTRGLAAQQSVPEGTPAGVLILDADSGEALAQVGADVPRVPASSLKLLTAAAVMVTLDRAETPVTRTSLGEGSVLTLVGDGDVLLAPGAGNAGAVVGRAGLADLADATAAGLAEAGALSVTLRLDDTALPAEGLAAGLLPEDARWVMPPAALAVEEGASSGARAADPALEATELFASALRDRGVDVVAVERGSEPEEARELAAVRGAPVGDLVRYALKESDNTLTEALARRLALARGLTPDRAGSGQAVLDVLAEHGVDLTGVHLADTSGLSPHNRATAIALAQTLDLGVRSTGVAVTGNAQDETQDASHEQDAAQDGTQDATKAPGTGANAAAAATPGLIGMLPVAGLDGTLHDRLTTGAAGVARAKTGTLGAVASLAGTVVDADGRLLVYVVLTDGLPRGGMPAARAATDEFVTALAACGCS